MTKPRLVLAAIVIATLVPTCGHAGTDDQLLVLANGITASLNRKAIKRLAVVDFVSITGEKSLVSKYLTEQFTTLLIGQKRDFQVIDRSNLSTILSEQNLAESGLLDPTTVRRIGKLAGVDAVLIGTITFLPSAADLNLKVLDVETASIDAAQAISVDIPRLDSKPAESVATKQAATTAQPVKETPQQKKLRQAAEKAAKQQKGIAYQEQKAFEQANVQGCEDPRSVEVSTAQWSTWDFRYIVTPYVSIRILNQSHEAIDIESTENGLRVKNLCDGGSATVFRPHVSGQGPGVSFILVAHGHHGGVLRSETYTMSVYQASAKQSYQWIVGPLQK